MSINPDFGATARAVQDAIDRVHGLAALDSTGDAPPDALAQAVQDRVAQAMRLAAARKGYTPVLAFAINALRGKDWDKALRHLAKAYVRALPGPGGRVNNSRLAGKQAKPWAPKPQAATAGVQDGQHLGRGFVES